MDLCTYMFVGTTFTTAKQWGWHAWPWMDKQISKNTHTGVSLAQKRRKVLSRATTQWTQDSMFSDIEASPQRQIPHESSYMSSLETKKWEGGCRRGEQWGEGEGRQVGRRRQRLFLRWILFGRMNFGAWLRNNVNTFKDPKRSCVYFTTSKQFLSSTSENWKRKGRGAT